MGITTGIVFFSITVLLNPYDFKAVSAMRGMGGGRGGGWGMERGGGRGGKRGGGREGSFGEHIVPVYHEGPGHYREHSEHRGGSKPSFHYHPPVGPRPSGGHASRVVTYPSPGQHPHPQTAPAPIAIVEVHPLPQPPKHKLPTPPPTLHPPPPLTPHQPSPSPPYQSSPSPPHQRPPSPPHPLPLPPPLPPNPNLPGPKFRKSSKSAPPSTKLSRTRIRKRPDKHQRWPSVALPEPPSGQSSKSPYRASASKLPKSKEPRSYKLPTPNQPPKPPEPAPLPYILPIPPGFRPTPIPPSRPEPRVPPPSPVEHPRNPRPGSRDFIKNW